MLLPFGPQLISVDEASTLRVWKIEEAELAFELEFDVNSFEITKMCQPPTYLNKILLGSRQGPIRLFNVKTNKMIFEFAGWNSAISAMEPSTAALDVVAFGLADGRIHLHNIKVNETLFSFRQDFGEVTAISFRSDGPQQMLSATPQGHVIVWNLEDQKLVIQMENLHKSAVCGLAAIANEPVFVTNGADNSLRTWIFDRSDGGARQLCAREGHAAPPLVARFVDRFGEIVISAGMDSTVKIFSTIKPTKYQNFGTAGLMSRKQAKRRGRDPEAVKYPPIIQLATDLTRESGWDNVVACHQDYCINFKISIFW